MTLQEKMYIIKQQQENKKMNENKRNIIMQGVILEKGQINKFRNSNFFVR